MLSAQSQHARAASVARAIGVAVLLSLSLLGTAYTPAHAASARVSQPVATLTVPLNVDCSRVPNTPQAKAILTKQNLCGYGKRLSPYGIVRIDGDCGSLILGLFDNGGGWMQWKGEITSTQGPFTTASYGGYYQVEAANQVSVWRVDWVDWTTDWVDIFSVNTGPGEVFAGINSAIDQLWWGGICTGGPLYNDIYIN